MILEIDKVIKKINTKINKHFSEGRIKELIGTIHKDCKYKNKNGMTISSSPIKAWSPFSEEISLKIVLDFRFKLPVYNLTFSEKKERSKPGSCYEILKAPKTSVSFSLRSFCKKSAMLVTSRCRPDL